MSYRVEFTGSLLERRNIAQATSSNNLTSSVTLSPSGWDNITNLSSFFSGTNPFPNAYVIGDGSGDFSNYSGGDVDFNGGESNGAWFATPNLSAGTYTFQFRIYNTVGGGFANWSVERVNSSTRDFSSGTSVIDTQFGSISSDVTRSLTFSVSSGNWIFLRLAVQCRVDYVRLIGSGGSINITDSTSTEGVAPTGGTSISENITTLTEGFNGINGPANKIIVSTDNEGPKVNLKHPAETTENTDIQLKSSKIITANNTSLDVSASGLDATNQLKSIDTKLTVTELKDATEN